MMSAHVEPLNPFLALDCPSLTPKSDNFNPELWFESVAEFRRREPNRYPAKAMGILYRDLSVYGYKSSADYQRTFGNYPTTLLRKVFGRGRTQVTIFSGFDGVIQKGEMLLVLGRPGSGCTTLLKTLAGEMHGLHVGNRSELKYNGKTSS